MSNDPGFHGPPDFGKVRVYPCGNCGGDCIRPLRGEPKPCDRCDAPLGDYYVDDLRRNTRERLGFYGGDND